MIRIGSRGSQLALWQANFIADALRGLGHEVAIEIIRTTGDRMQEIALSQVGTKGMFTKEIEEALLAGAVDLAVHSLKDLPTDLGDAFTLASIPKRADSRDVLVSDRFASFANLPHGAVIGTSSLRRQSQLRHHRPDLHCIEFRGNVDTRLSKLAQGKADALVLAAAGLDRLHKTDWIRQRFSPDMVCPAPGQGALGIECRAGDSATISALLPLDDRDTRLAVTAERDFLTALGGGCQVPIGAYCWTGDQFSSVVGAENRATKSGEDAEFWLQGVVASVDGEQVIEGRVHHSDPAVLGSLLADQFLAQGADAILHLSATHRS